MPIIDDTSITEILSSDDVVSEIANTPHDDLKAHIDEINAHHDDDLVHSGNLTVSGGDLYVESGVMDSLTADDVYLPSVVKIKSLVPLSANVTSEALNELTSGGETTLHTHGERDIKAWVNFNGSGAATIGDSYNVSSVVYNGTGDYTINWDTDFANADYAWVASGRDNNDLDSTVIIRAKLTDAKTSASLQIRTLTGADAGIITDLPEINIMAIGDQ